MSEVCVNDEENMMTCIVGGLACCLLLSGVMHGSYEVYSKYMPA